MISRTGVWAGSSSAATHRRTMSRSVTIPRSRRSGEHTGSAPTLCRLMSRAEAKQAFTVSEFKKQMSEVYTTSVNSSTLDECPMAYKNMEDIVENIGPTAELVNVIKPVYNFKAGE